MGFLFIFLLVLQLCLAVVMVIVPLLALARSIVGRILLFVDAKMFEEHLCWIFILVG